MQKQELRRIVSNVLKRIEPGEKARQSRVIENYLFTKSQNFKNAKHIGVYISQNSQEIDTISIIRNILLDFKASKSIYIPHVNFKSIENEMKFYQVKTIEQFENEMASENKYKLKQFKNIDNLVEVNSNTLDLILVPAIAFSIEKSNRYSRLGRGKGYYDRYLSAIPYCYTIGLAFNEQLIPNDHVNFQVPVEEKVDFSLNEVLCENLILERYC